MDKATREKDSELFKEEVKQLLSGNLADENVVNYIALKIARLHEQHVENILKKEG